MTFGATFGRVISPTFKPGSVASNAAWWLSGGIAAANCVAAYQAKGAASYAASKVNLTGDAAYNLVEVGSATSWDATTGWSSGENKSLSTEIVPLDSYTLIFRMDSSTPKNFRGLIGCAKYHISYLSSWYLTIGSEKYSGNTSTSGIFAVCNRKLYLNGTAITTQCNTATITAKLYFMDVAGSSYIPHTLQAAAIYNLAISEAQLSALTTAMAAL